MNTSNRVYDRQACAGASKPEVEMAWARRPACLRHVVLRLCGTAIAWIQVLLLLRSREEILLWAPASRLGDALVG
jgi:hypothetical protein